MPKERLVAERLAAGAVPVPERPTICGLPNAVSVIVSEPLRVPVDLGIKVKLIAQLAPAVTLDPQLFVWAKSPLVAILAIVSATFLILVSVTVWALLVVPMICPANARLAGDTVREGFATPVADSATTVGELLALLTIEMLPVALPVLVGTKLALKVARPPPAGTVRGSERPLMLKPDPITLACDTQMGVVPGLSSVTVFVLLSPNMTDPKLALVGLT